MKGLYKIFLAISLSAAMLCSCKEEYVTYSDAEYVMFADTVSVNMVLEDEYWFNVPVVSTVACKYDRTFGVEIIDKGSNAIEGYHYSLKSNTVTIPAGELSADVEVHGVYDNLKPSEPKEFILRLVMPDNLKWSELYNDCTKVVMYKSCPFHIEEFTGWCVVTSLFLKDFPGTENRSYQRLIRTEKNPAKENSVILRNWLFNGYDVCIDFDPSDPAKPLVTMEEGQVISAEMPLFGISYGDNKVRVCHSPYSVSSFNTCQKFVSLWILAYVEDLGELYGTVGEFYNVLEWVSDEEADRLKRENGM